MTRTKVKLTLINDEIKRKSCLKKRKRGLKKKVSELNTLCGVDCCVIIYNPLCPEQDVWPSPIEAQQVIAKYSNMPKFEKEKKMVDQEKIGEQELAKAIQQLEKTQKEIRLKELTMVVNKNMSDRGWFQSLDDDYLIYLYSSVLMPNLDEMEKRLAMFHQNVAAEE